MRENREPASPARLTDLPSFGKPPLIYGSQRINSSQHAAAAKADDDDIDDDNQIEFAFVVRESDACLAISADEIFADGRIRPLCAISRIPVLARSSTAVREKPIRPRLLQFLKEERDEASSTTSADSSSLADDLEGLTPGTYCLWSPGLPSNRVEKRASTDSVFRWLIRDLGSNCGSGKEDIIFLASKKKRSPGNKRDSEADKKTGKGDIIFLASKKKRSPGNKPDSEADKKAGKGKKGKEMSLIDARRQYSHRNSFGVSQKATLSYKLEIGGCCPWADATEQTPVRHRNANLYISSMHR